MKALSKALAVFIGLADYAAGITVAITLIFKFDYYSVFFIQGMSTYESIFFNTVLFSLGLALAGIVLSLLVNEYKKTNNAVVFPLIYEIIPVIISAVCIYFGFGGDTVREKLAVIGGAILYAVLSAVVIYSGARVFQVFAEDK